MRQRLGVLFKTISLAMVGAGLPAAPGGDGGRRRGSVGLHHLPHR